MALSTGRDVLSRQKTGSGKSLSYQLPALSDWRSGWTAYTALAASDVAETRRLRQLPQITVLIAPWVALCDDQEREASEYFRWAFERGLIPVQAQVLYARAAPSPRPATAAAAAAATARRAAAARGSASRRRREGPGNAARSRPTAPSGCQVRAAYAAPIRTALRGSHSCG